MPLKEKILEDMKNSMKSGDKLRTGALRMLRAEIMKKENEKAGAVVDDAAVMTIVKKLVKQRKEAAEQFEKGDRQQLAEKEKKEAEILEEYLPPKLTEEDLKQLIQSVMDETGAMSMKDMGKVMGGVMKKIKEDGQVVDGKRVKNLVSEALSTE